MEELPMHNYVDLPRENIEPWCVFFEGLESVEKCSLLRQIWSLLTSTEQNLVINDMKTFLSQNLSQENDIDSDHLQMSKLSLGGEHSHFP
jgi:hypothetical protein